MTKTAVIYGNVVDEDKYSIVDGDWSRFDKIWINSCVDTHEEDLLQEELGDLLYDGEGNFKLNEVSFKEFIAFIRANVDCPVIRIGCLP